MTDRATKPLTSEDLPALSVYVLTRFDDLTQTDDPTEVREVFEDFIAFAPDLARAVIDLTAKVELRDKALEAVLALHQPVTDGMGFTEDGYGGISPACSSCGTSDEYAVPYPCPTVTAITTALEATK